MFERIKSFFMRRKIDKAVVESLKEQNQSLKNRIDILENNTPKKRCPKCKQYKLYSDFNKNKTKKDGLQTECKDCHRLMLKRNNPNRFTPDRKEFYGWYLITSERYISYEINNTVYTIIDIFRFNYLCNHYWKDMVRGKVMQLIKWLNKNNMRHTDEDYFYRLRAWLNKQQIMDNEKQGKTLFQ